MTKEQYIQQEQEKLERAFCPKLLILGALAIIGLGIFDYFASPQNLSRFLLYRSVAAFAYLVLYLINKSTQGKHVKTMFFFLTLIVSGMLAFMAFQTGGDSSVYLDGVIVVFVFLFGFVPMQMKMTSFLAGVIYITYIFPVLIFDCSINFDAFIADNILMAVIVISGLVWRYYNSRLLVSKFGLEFDLLQKNNETRQAWGESVEKFHAITNTATDAIVLMDDQGRISYWNPAAERMFGYSSIEAMGRELHILIAPNEYHESYRCGFEEFKYSGQGIAIGNTIEFFALHKDGTRFPIEVSTSALKIRDKWHAAGIIRDITDRKKAEEALRDSEEKYRSLVNNVNIGIYRNTGDMSGRFLQANPAIVKIFGYDTVEDFMKIHTADLYQDAEERQKFVDKIEKYGLVTNEELKLKKKDGTLISGSVTAKVQYAEDGGIAWIDGVIEDITERKKALEELRQSEEKFRDLVENLNDVMYSVDRNGFITYISPNIVNILGLSASELTGVHFTKILYEDDIERITERFRELITTGNIVPAEYRMNMKSGGFRWVRTSSRPVFDDNGNIVSIFGVLMDITATKQIQEQLLHSQKMESIGVLAGGVAHNFNNILTTILSYACSISDSGKIDKASRQKLQIIEKAVRKAGTIVSNLMNFARSSGKEGTIFDLNNVIMDTLKIFEGVIRKNITLRSDLEEHLPYIGGDPDKIEQVLMNLLVNAKDAMTGGGTISIKTSSIEIKGESSSAPSVKEPGEYVMLTVSDTGCGIDKEIIEKIFDPFFTTKQKGKGSGLGLASVYGIVREYSGYIEVSSNTGKGTTFTIYLPVVKQLHLETRRKEVSIDGTENILLIDDDVDVLTVTKEILREHGYHVTAVYDSSNAVEIFKEHSDKIQLVITDLVMPLVDGDEFIKISRGIKPEIKVIVISAYPQNLAASASIDAVIQKPFENAHLLSTVRQVLDHGQEEQLFLEDRQGPRAN